MVHTLTIERDARAPARARRALEDLPGIDPSLVPNAQLLITELITNSVKYGDGPLSLRFDTSDGDRLRVDVADDGVGFTPSARRKPATDVGGWGLYLVEAVADSWGVYDGSTHVWFELTPEA